MGKRKERRLAALSNAGRRVKLDLFAEPSEDLNGSQGQDDRDPKHEPALPLPLPNSPSSSSSGQQPPNPLLLLGQYSDDDESDKRVEDGVVHNSLADHADQVKGPLNKVDAGESQASQKADQQDQETDSLPLNDLKNLEGSDTRERDDHVPNDSHKEKDSSDCNSISGTSELQVIGDVGSGWRMVMHEESNQCYYWNTETGETSWEVPNVLAQTTQSISDQKAPAVDHTEIALEGPHDSKSNSGVQLDDTSAAVTIDGSMAGNLIHESKVYDTGVQLAAQDVGYKTESHPDVNEIESQSNFNAVNSHIALASSPGSENCMYAVLAGEEHKMGTDISSNLVKQGECLLERMKSLKVSEDHLQGQSWMSDYILELEIRLSDIKSLLLYGSSMLPFWVHSERQLNRLEDAINNKIYQFAKSVAMDEADETPISFGEKFKSHESLGNQSQADGYGSNTTCSTPDVSPVSADANAPRAVKFESNGQAQQDAACVSSFGSPAEHLEIGTTVNPHIVGNAHLDDTNPKIGSYAGEDDDMDVDMEVEDVIPASTTMLQDVPSTTMLEQYPAAEHSAVAPLPNEDWIPPPPPDNDQFPPPPPDDEQVPPPPPPDEPPESYPLPPSYMETAQPLSCTEQYNISYPDSTYQYYGHGHGVTEVSVSNMYGHVDASQVALPQASIYYQTVPNTAASLLVNPVDTKIFYDLQGQQLPSLPVDSIAGSSHLHSESDPMTYSTLASNKSGSTDAVPIERSTVKNNVSVFTEKTEIESVGVSSSSATIEAPATHSVKESVSAAAAAAAAAAAVAVAGSSTTSKLQSKASRAKKRTVAVASSLRSSKKVSSLVDKWKAAKEELNEVEEDEPASAYEILEKKRQREIEEWHAQQIASGEAKDNANFQPLGGDWREKVKRRRAGKAKESKGSVEISAEVLPEGNQEPDLAELSKNLPSGWQAYWDEASKQVYYGNINTSETTWTRPTK